jgi:hypothetical protein
MIEALAVFVFIALDAGAVVIALLWLSERRLLQDGNNARDRRDRRGGEPLD